MWEPSATICILLLCYEDVHWVQVVRDMAQLGTHFKMQHGASLILKCKALCVVAPRSTEKTRRHSSTLKKVAIYSSEMSVCRRTTRPYSPEYYLIIFLGCMPFLH
jgi:hypothetical protein